MRTKQTIKALGLKKYELCGNMALNQAGFTININVLCNGTINYYNFYQIT